MANRPSDVIAGILATPPVRQAVLRNVPLFAYAEISIAVSDGTGFIYPLVRLPADCRILQVWRANSSMTGNTAFTFAAYQTGDWTLADQPQFGPVIDPFSIVLSLAPVNGWQSLTILGNTGGLPLWSGTNLTSQPRSGTELDLGLVAGVAGTPSAGTARFGFLYVVGI